MVLGGGVLNVNYLGPPIAIIFYRLFRNFCVLTLVLMVGFFGPGNFPLPSCLG
jgi:hypothetical protein